MRRLKGKIVSLVMTFLLVFGCLAGYKLPARAATPPVIEITSLVTNSPNEQSFSVYVDREASYSASNASGSVWDGTLAAGTQTLTFNSSDSVNLQVWTFYDRDDNGSKIPYSRNVSSAMSYYMNISFVGRDGTSLGGETVVMDYYNYPEYTCTPPASIDMGDGTCYLLEGEAYRVFSYGQESATIYYTKGTMDAHPFTVTYVDQNNQEIYSYSDSLEYGESAHIEAPETYEKDGKTYQLETANSSFDVTYDNVASVYTFEYAEVIPAPAEPYEITINLVDSENNNALLYSIRQTVDVDSTVHVDLPSTYEVNFKKYVLADGVEKFIEREFSSTRSTEYTIPYVVAEESAPYDITINFVDYNNPETVLSAMTATITPDGEPFIYDVNASAALDVNGVQYQVLAGQGNDNGQIVHTYGTATRTYNVYYSAQEVEEPQPYTVTLRYISIEDNSVLETQQQEVAYGSSVSFDAAPEELTVGDTNYVLLNGQDEAITHDYNESQTSYAVYYRDADVEVEVEPEVITQVVTQYVTEDDGTAAENEDGTTVPVNVPVTTVTGEDGEETTYNEEGQQVTIEDGNVVTLEDEETPLAEGPETSAAADDDAEASADSTTTIEDETTPLGALPVEADSNGSSVNMPLIIGGVAVVAVVIIAGVCIAVIRKKNSAK